MHKTKILAALSNSDLIFNNMVKCVNVYLGNGQSSQVVTDSINLQQAVSLGSRLSSTVNSVGTTASATLPDPCKLIANTLTANGKPCSQTFIVQQVINI
jgi:hypothetical protein